MADQRTSHTPMSIAEHGLIGDLHTAALVATDGTSTGSAARGSTRPRCSARCSTRRRAATAGVRPVGTEYVTKQLYLPDTAVLITRFLARTGSARSSTSCRRPARWRPRSTGWSGWSLRPRPADFEVEVAPRFDYGRREHTLQLTAAGAVFTAGDAG
jgi:hypothetical protein